MDDNEMEEVLYRLDERTAMMDQKLEVQSSRTIQQRERINEVETLSKDNRTILNALTFGLGTFITAVVGKLTGLINF